MSHGRHDHRGAPGGRLLIALVLAVGVIAAQLGGGVRSGSLALPGAAPGTGTIADE